MLMTATPMFPGDIPDRIREDPGWVTKVYPMMVTMPKNNEAWEKYAAVYRGEIAALANGVEPEMKAVDYYLSHRDELDEGAVPFSPHVYTRGVEASAIQHAMNII